MSCLSNIYRLLEFRSATLSRCLKEWQNWIQKLATLSQTQTRPSPMAGPACLALDSSAMSVFAGKMGLPIDINSFLKPSHDDYNDDAIHIVSQRIYETLKTRGPVFWAWLVYVLLLCFLLRQKLSPRRLTFTIIINPWALLCPLPPFMGDLTLSIWPKV